MNTVIDEENKKCQSSFMEIETIEKNSFKLETLVCEEFTQEELYSLAGQEAFFSDGKKEDVVPRGISIVMDYSDNYVFQKDSSVTSSFLNPNCRSSSMEEIVIDEQSLNIDNFVYYGSMTENLQIPCKEVICEKMYHKSSENRCDDKNYISSSFDSSKKTRK